jgi:hypothetical protein
MRSCRRLSIAALRPPGIARGYALASLNGDDATPRARSHASADRAAPARPSLPPGRSGATQPQAHCRSSFEGAGSRGSSRPAETPGFASMRQRGCKACRHDRERRSAIALGARGAAVASNQHSSGGMQRAPRWYRVCSRAGTSNGASSRRSS